MDDEFPDDIGAGLEASSSTSDVQASSTISNAQAEPHGKKRKNEKDNEGTKKTKLQENRAIFVTNLPLDTNENEIEEEFKKYGIIDEGTGGKKRIKMYTDDEGKFNGEALIVYFRKESIDLAIRMMDDYWFRISDQSNGTIRVKEADFSYKKYKDGDQIASKLTRKDKKAAERHRADLNRKLAEWSDNEDEVVETYAAKRNKWEKIVILKNAFTLEELAEDPDAYNDIIDSVREEAEKDGPVTNVMLFDLEKDGIMSVQFEEYDAAESFSKKAHGRKFAGGTLVAYVAEDFPRFKKTKEEKGDTESFNPKDAPDVDHT